jgi:8-oxo-dGTP diphosphatase
VNGLDKPKVIVLGYIFFKNEILLIKRNKKPFNNQWGLIGGKLELNESIKEGILREVFEETNLKCKFIKFNSVDQIIFKKENKTYIRLFSTLESKSEKFIESDEGELKWFNLNLLPENMIKADRYLVENCLNQEIKIPYLIYNEKNFKIIKS